MNESEPFDAVRMTTSLAQREADAVVYALVHELANEVETERRAATGGFGEVHARIEIGRQAGPGHTGRVARLGEKSSKPIGQKGRQASLGEDLVGARQGEKSSRAIGQTAVRRAS